MPIRSIVTGNLKEVVFDLGIEGMSVVGFDGRLLDRSRPTLGEVITIPEFREATVSFFIDTSELRAGALVQNVGGGLFNTDGGISDSAKAHQAVEAALVRHADRTAGELARGTKRKTSVDLAACFLSDFFG